jgi:hypothetical protein
MAVPAGAYTGRVLDYTMVSGYGTHGGLLTTFQLNTREDGADSEPAVSDTVLVQFGDHDVGPGATVGHFTDHESFKSFDVRLPQEAVHTFWRAIQDFRVHNQNEDCFLAIVWNADNDIFDFGVVVIEDIEGAAGEDRRGRIDAMRREAIDSWRQRLGVAGDSY